MGAPEAPKHEADLTNCYVIKYTITCLKLSPHYCRTTVFHVIFCMENFRFPQIKIVFLSLCT